MEDHPPVQDGGDTGATEDLNCPGCHKKYANSRTKATHMRKCPVLVPPPRRNAPTMVAAHAPTPHPPGCGCGEEEHAEGVEGEEPEILAIVAIVRKDGKIFQVRM
jgi:hypothetical protein